MVITNSCYVCVCVSLPPLEVLRYKIRVGTHSEWALWEALIKFSVLLTEMKESSLPRKLRPLKIMCKQNHTYYVFPPSSSASCLQVCVCVCVVLSS